MGKYIYPDDFADSIFDINFDYLYKKELFNLIIDLDNTLSRWGSKRPDIDVCNWIKTIRKKGFKICILSNSSNNRINNYCCDLDVLFVKNVNKPFKSSFIRAMAIMDSNNRNTCVIGDQIFTDILGGNLCSMYTILVPPIDNNEFILTKFLRILEKAILKNHYK